MNNECKVCEGYGYKQEVDGVMPTPNGPEEIILRVECEVCEGTGENNEGVK